MATLTIGIESLLVDPQNARHEPVNGQAAAIRAIIDEQGSKLTNLARDIVEHGLSPLDRVLVVKSGKNYRVLEGNRRVLALKLLNNPSLADGTAISEDIKKVAAHANAPKDVECEIANSRREAKRWLILRHQGEQDGRGVVPWNPVSSARFNAEPGSREARWVTFIDAVQAAYPANEKIQAAIQTIASGRITTLGRLYSDPDFRDHLGLKDDGGGLLSHFPAESLEAVLQRVLGDLAGDLSVSKIKSKEQRETYIKSLPKPPAREYHQEAKPLGASFSSATPAATRPPARRQTRPASPFKDLDLQRLDQRIDDIVRELKKLDLEKFPNAAAVLSRVLLELSLDQFIAKKSLTFTKQSPKLRDKLKRCLHEVDPTDKDSTYQSLRAGLNDGSSIYAVATLHGYVHNKHFHPTPTDVRGIVANLKPLLQQMNDLV